MPINPTLPRPLANAETLALVTAVLAGDVTAAAEAVMRLASTHPEAPERPALVAALNAVLVFENKPEPKPLVPTSPAAPAASLKPFDMEAPDLCAAIEGGVKGAWKEAKRRIAAGSRHAAKFKAARKALKARQRGETVETPEPAGSRRRTASGLLASRVKALAGEGDRARAGIRATHLVKQDPISLEDVEALSDEECLKLVRRPIRSDDTVLKLLEG